MKGLRDLFQDILVATGVDVALDSLRKEAPPLMAERIKKKITDETRGKLFKFLVLDLAAEDSVASEALLRRQEDRAQGRKISYKDGTYPTYSENTFVDLLTKLYVASDDTEEGKAERLQAFVVLGRITDEKFDSALEFLNNDCIAQNFSKFLAIAKMKLGEATEFIMGLGENKAIQELDAFGAKKVQEFRKFLNSKGVKR